jgi:hypothetical protein
MFFGMNRYANANGMNRDEKKGMRVFGLMDKLINISCRLCVLEPIFRREYATLRKLISLL